MTKTDKITMAFGIGLNVFVYAIAVFAAVHYTV